LKQIEEELTPFGMVNTGVPEKVTAEVVGGDLWITGSMDEYMNKLKQTWYDDNPHENRRFYK